MWHRARQRCFFRVPHLVQNSSSGSASRQPGVDLTNAVVHSQAGPTWESLVFTTVNQGERLVMFGYVRRAPRLMSRLQKLRGVAPAEYVIVDNQGIHSNNFNFSRWNEVEFQTWSSCLIDTAEFKRLIQFFRELLQFSVHFWNLTGQQSTSWYKQPEHLTRPQRSFPQFIFAHASDTVHGLARSLSTAGLNKEQGSGKQEEKLKNNKKKKTQNIMWKWRLKQ